MCLEAHIELITYIRNIIERFSVLAVTALDNCRLGLAVTLKDMCTASPKLV